MSLYRSDDVNYFKLILPRQSAWIIMNKLGQKRLIHINNKKSSIINQSFLPQLKRCEELLLKINQLQNSMKVHKNTTERNNYSQQQFIKLFEHWQAFALKEQKNYNLILHDIDIQINKNCQYFNDICKRLQNSHHKVDFYRENLAIIKQGSKIYGQAFYGVQSINNNQLNLLGQNVLLQSPVSTGLKFGIIKKKDQIKFQKAIFRITKGNSFVNFVSFEEIFQTIHERQVQKLVFYIMYPSQSQNYLQNKIMRLISLFSDQQYNIPHNSQQCEKLINFLENSQKDAKVLEELTEIDLNKFIISFHEIMPNCTWRNNVFLKMYLIKQNQIYQKLNNMSVYNNFLQGQIYVLNKDIISIQNTLNQLQEDLKMPTGQIIYSQSTKFPTHFIKNSYIISSQEIVQTYGIPNYKQANPSFFTTITFPFLFGVMFGDIGHGAILLFFASLMIIMKERLKFTKLKFILPHRYLILLMGFFSFYCGFIYNDYLSISLNLFKSCYDPNQTDSDGYAIHTNDCVYPFGIDPIWSQSKSYLTFVNSLKMKLSIIIAVIHMLLGIFIKGSNAIYFKKRMEFFFEFIPQFIFMIVLFGYMDFLIIFKWLKNWEQSKLEPPSVITTMINLPLKIGQTNSCTYSETLDIFNCSGGGPMWGGIDGTSQSQLQLLLIILAVISIPLMLLPKPIYEIYCRNKNQTSIYDQSNLQEIIQGNEMIAIQNQSLISSKNSQNNNQQNDSSQIFVHQLIETIQYVLGCISNTASYLRLWALSLAHSQLSEVFINKTIQSGIQSGYSGIPIMFLGFFVLALVTFGVLLCMDVMECFLHTLRLHWVQFQNKFYKGSGFLFSYYSFIDTINKEIQNQK